MVDIESSVFFKYFRNEKNLTRLHRSEFNKNIYTAKNVN